MTVSVIVPVYNEEKVIRQCLASLTEQTKKEIEVIVVDDGSTDGSFNLINKIRETSRLAPLARRIILLQQKHLGPGAARNLGAKMAHGEILVFVDSDMTFDKNFIKDLVAPIEQKKTKGTFTKEEYVSNWDNIWARCWNYNNNIRTNRRIPENYPDIAPVFRAVLKSEYMKVHGFTGEVGWTDDWSLSQKLGYQSTATHAVCYHANPGSLNEVFVQASWIGKNEYFTGTIPRLGINLIRFSSPVTFLTGISKSLIYQTPGFLLFKAVYDFAVSLSLWGAVLGNRVKNK